MKLDRAIAIQLDVKSRIADVYSAARFYRSTSRDINARVNTVLASLPNGTPGWVRSYLRGWADALGDVLQRDCIVYGVWHAGQFYSVHRTRPDYYEKAGMTAREFGEVDGLRGLFWADRPERPYFADATRDC